MMASKKQMNPFDMLYPGIADSDDPIERHMMRQQRMTAPFCKYCGRPITNADTDSNGMKVDGQWEMMNEMHYVCHANDLEAKRQKAKRESRIEWDKYMDDMMRRRDDGTDD